MTEEFKTLLKEMSSRYDIRQAFNQFSRRLEQEMKTQDGDLLEPEEMQIVMSKDMDSMTLHVSYDVECNTVRYYPGSRFDPPDGGYFDGHSPDIDIQQLKQMLNSIGLKITGVSAACAGSLHDRIAPLKSNRDFSDFFDEYLTNEYYSFDHYHNLDAQVPVLASIQFDIDLADFAKFGAFLMPCALSKDDAQLSVSESYTSETLKSRLHKRAHSLSKIAESYDQLDKISDFKDRRREETAQYAVFFDDDSFVADIFMSRMHQSSFGKMVRVEGCCMIGNNQYSVYITTRAQSFRDALQSIVSDLHDSKSTVRARDIDVVALVAGDRLAVDPSQQDDDGFGAAFAEVNLLKLAQISPKSAGNEWMINCGVTKHIFT